MKDGLQEHPVQCDARGREVPGRLWHVFEGRRKLAAWCAALDGVMDSLRVHALEPYGAVLDPEEMYWLAATIKDHVLAAMPRQECGCRPGPLPCELCNGRGWTTSRCWRKEPIMPPRQQPSPAAQVTVIGDLLQQPIVDDLTAPRRKFCRFDVQVADRCYSVIAYDLVAETCGRVRTGSQVMASGKLLVHRAKRRDGQQQTRLEIEAEAVDVLRSGRA